MAEIQLTKGYVAIIDDEDLPRVQHMKWWAAVREHTVYARGGLRDGHAAEEYLHRYLLNVPTGVLVDHRDGNGLNCRRSNIRVATHAQNNANMRTPVGEAGYRGVYPSKNARGEVIGFVARMSHNNRTKYCGFFRTPLEAALAYDEVAVELRGPFARTNFPRRAA
jgi:hypothetical protein